MELALTDAVVVIFFMVLIGLFGYLMDRQVDRGGDKKNHTSHSGF
jgi:hypothetical protein